MKKNEKSFDAVWMMRQTDEAKDTRVQGITHTAARQWDGHARVDGWMSGARTWAVWRWDGHARVDG